MEKEMLLTKFETYLRGEEKSESTISKYLHDVGELLDFMGQECLSKELLIQYRVFPKQKDIKKQPMFTCLQTKEYCY